MAANSNALILRLCEQIIGVYDATLARRKHHERVVRDCRELLKPWPRKKISDKCAESPPGKPMDGDRPRAELEAGKDAVVPEAERAALELAEKALVTAHRLRHKQAKVIERETSLDRKELLSNGTKTESEHETKDKESNGNRPLTEKAKETTPLGSKTKPKSSVACKSGSAGERSTHASRPSQGREHEGKRSTQGQPRSAGRLLQGRPPLNKTEISRPGSGKQQAVGVISQSTLKKVLKTAGSTNSRPVHLSAPFKTDASAPRVKHRPTRASALRQTQVQGQRVPGKSGQVRQENRYHGHRKPPAPEDNTVEQISYDDNTSQEPADGRGNVLVDVASPVPVVPQWVAEADNGGDFVSSTPVSSVTPLSARDQLDGACDEDSSPEPAQFELLQDGHTLTVPGKLRKAVSVNNKLRHQLHTATLTVPASRQNSPAAAFLNKLSEHYEATTSKAHRDAVHMLALYKRLAALMEQLHRDKPKDAACGWQEVLRTKRLMENVCLTYADLEEDYHQLVGDCSAAPSPQDLTAPVPDVRPASLWLPPHIHTVTECKLRLQPVVRYRRSRDAELYLKLVHDLQLLQLKLYLMDQTANTLLPLLDATDTDHRYFNSLYRSTYSLLCTDTQRRPIIIGDTVDDSVDN